MSFVLTAQVRFVILISYSKNFASLAMLTTLQALKQTLTWIDSVPQSLPLPGMPGFDREWVDAMIAGEPIEGAPAVTPEQALDMALEWVNAVPVELRKSLAPFDEATMKAALSVANIQH
jgi:hypothetical protein